MHFVGSYGIDTHIYKDEIKLYLYIRIILREHLILSLSRLSSTSYTLLRINCALRSVVFSSLSNMRSVSHCSFLYNTLIIVWRCRNLSSQFFSLDIRHSTDVSVPTGFLRCVLKASGVWWLACWPLAPKFAGSNPAEAVGFYGRKNPQHAFLPRGSKRISPMSQLCGV
jgi:hypothetical protein